MALTVQQRSAEVLGLEEAHYLTGMLSGGTRLMRKAGSRFLPRWPMESQEAWSTRLAVATLFPAFSRTVSVMVGKPFSQPITLGKDVPAKIQAISPDIDLQGTNLHAFCAARFEEVIAHGFGGILVDFPVTGGALRTLADEQQSGARPYWVPIRHDQILGWQVSVSALGLVTLSQLRLKECVLLPDGPFGTRQVERVRVLEPGKWSLWEDTNGDNHYVEISNGVTSLQSIPFAPLYGRRKDFMIGESPLLDLAYLNVKHWQSQSDQDNILHVARVPLLVVVGVDVNDKTWKVSAGSGQAIKLQEGMDMKYVEHSGAAISAGHTSLDRLEQQMIQTGAELLVKIPGQRTATESNNDAEANKSELQRIVEGFEDGLDQALQLTADWMGEPEGGHVSLFKDFGASDLSDAAAQLVLLMQERGLITRRTALTEQQRRGLISADIDPTTELAQAKLEVPDPAAPIPGAQVPRA